MLHVYIIKLSIIINDYVFTCAHIYKPILLYAQLNWFVLTSYAIPVFAALTVVPSTAKTDANTYYRE